MQTIDDMIAVLQAAKEGKQIQARHIPEETWQDVATSVWNFAYWEYRVKPKPRDFWISELTLLRCGFQDEGQATIAPGATDRIHVREILD